MVPVTFLSPKKRPTIIFGDVPKLISSLFYLNINFYREVGQHNFYHRSISSVLRPTFDKTIRYTFYYYRIFSSPYSPRFIFLTHISHVILHNYLHNFFRYLFCSYLYFLCLSVSISLFLSLLFLSPSLPLQYLSCFPNLNFLIFTSRWKISSPLSTFFGD